MVEGFCYITGHGGEIKTGVGEFLISLTPNLRGVSVNKEFTSQSLFDQVQQVKAEVYDCCDLGYPVLASSYGAELLLRALIKEEKLNTNVIMLSPAIGTLRTSWGPTYLGQKIEQGQIVKPSLLSICIGQEDIISHIPSIIELAEKLNADKFDLFPNERHMIKKDIVQQFIINALEMG
tara:strand:- start:432 stop:965 length:534 start_codon:yes stop_codon:yes gene_type:complete